MASSDKKSFVLYKSVYNPTIRSLPLEEKGMLFDAMFKYIIDGTLIDLPIHLEMAFSFMKDQFDRDAEKYEAICERNRLNGNKPKKKKPAEAKKASGLSGKPKKPNGADNDTATDNVGDSDNITDKKEEPPIGGDSEINKIDFKKLVEHYHTKCPGLPSITTMTNARKQAVNARVKEHGKAAVMEMFEKAGKSPFLNGDNDRGWRADFDWLFKPTKFVKIIEGNYPEKPERKQTYKPEAKKEPVKPSKW